MITDRDSTRNELGAFLRASRAQLGPGELGLVSTGRRRTPGLRREEVAAASGVGVSWYAWLEQGRVSASRAVLDALAATLRLDADGHAHLLALGGYAAEPGDAAADEALELLASWPGTPALALDHRFGVLRANPVARIAWPVSAGENLLLRLAGLSGWEEPLYELLLRFRALAARRPGDADGLFAELAGVRPDLGHFWDCRAVRRSGWSWHTARDGGTLRFRSSLVLPFGDDLHPVLLAVPADEPTQAAVTHVIAGTAPNKYEPGTLN